MPRRRVAATPRPRRGYSASLAPQVRAGGHAEKAPRRARFERETLRVDPRERPRLPRAHAAENRLGAVRSRLFGRGLGLLELIRRRLPPSPSAPPAARSAAVARPAALPRELRRRARRVDQRVFAGTPGRGRRAVGAGRRERVGRRRVVDDGLGRLWRLRAGEGPLEIRLAEGRVAHEVRTIARDAAASPYVARVRVRPVRVDRGPDLAGVRDAVRLAEARRAERRGVRRTLRGVEVVASEDDCRRHLRADPSSGERLEDRRR